mgnify:CR=1 FL=1
MRCWLAQRKMAASGDGIYPASVREHLARCASCRQLAEGMAFAQKLLALKRFEPPEPGFEDRSARRIRLALSAEQEATAARALAGTGWGPLPILRWTALAAALVLVAGHVVTRRPETLPSILADQSPRATPAPTLAVPPAVEPAIPLLSADFPQVATNRGAGGGVQYGPLPSTPVRFDY